jgi:putative oxidoreductase
MNSITRTFAQAYGGFSRLASMAQSPLLLAVRLYWGFQFMQAGWGKLHNLAHVTQFFMSMGIPAPGPTALSSAECC